MTENGSEARAATAVLAGASTVFIWGMSSAERLRRQLARAGVQDVRADAEGVSPDADVMILRLDWAYEQRLIDELAIRPGVALVAGGAAAAANVKGAQAAEAVAEIGAGRVPDGLEALDSEGLAGSYNRKLRKREIAYLIPLDERSVAEVEARSFAGSYKGVTDVVTKYVWPRPAKAVTKWCAEREITPNAVTYLGLALMFLALFLFWNGNFLLGLIPAWIMTFLDTVDGKLARVTMTSSKFGDVLDHGIDLIHPPFWWIAWIWGLPKAGFEVPHADLMIWIIVGGYIVQRVFEGAFIRLWGFHMHVWRPFDSFFRLITARRNPNLVILTALTLVGRPDWGMILVCAWIVLSLVVHLAQLVQAMILSRHARLVSWLDAA
ncbi:CDP-alcohol phosphatidyltransferase family protein [Hansschlegelia zhihuaiae]|uniref:CDP-alcohol phosphatidyltransferase family protein n=1 Tax=Hansschlegelia zhihuaiae TaxID=405005 RepID=A0A4Q0MNY9_9HYPH|nr:CDP-alcohol phosphatidyltransferase family protein [Hansschlegelia zhihuaiae]RXF75510.1 CDP-alcohol phosphatidyltransferase family protein [Hansschlegelia zhihuaiae]